MILILLILLLIDFIKFNNFVIMYVKMIWIVERLMGIDLVVEVDLKIFVEV